MKEQRETEQRHANELATIHNQYNETQLQYQHKLDVMQTQLHETQLQYQTHLQEVEQKHRNDLAIFRNKLHESEHKNKLLIRKLAEKKMLVHTLQSVLHSKDIKIARLEGISENVETNRDKLNDTIADIAKQPKTNQTNTNNTTNQNIILNSLDLEDTDHVQTVLKKHMTKEVLYKGQEGVAMLVDKNLLRDEDGNHKYKCTDVSRQRFEYMNKEGDVVTDHKANKLINTLTTAKLCKTFHDAASEYYYKENGSLNDEEILRLQSPVHEVMNIQKDSTKFRSKLCVLTAK